MTSPGTPSGNTPTTTGTNSPSPLPHTVIASVPTRRAVFVLPPPTDRYELGEEIARGGMGAVHHARDRNLDRELALKVLLERFAHNPTVIARFVEEALIGGKLQHPNLVPVHEVGTLPDGRPFIALKLIKGRTLAAVLAERRAPADDLPLRLGEFKQVCRAVGYAHAHNVIHRDLKPGNVMVGRHGEVQVMDWGVAKVLTDGAKAGAEPEPEVAEPPATEITVPRAGGVDSNTQVGDVLGTPSYMAPEQARGVIAAVNERSDVFGLGAILCELLTGQPPYPGTTRDACRVLSVVADMTPVHARLDACGADPALVALTKRCLDPDPAGRPADGGAVADAIESHLTGVQHRLERAEVARAEALVREAEERKRRRVQLALFAAVFGIVAACGAGFAIVREQRAARAAQTAQVANEAVGRMESLRDQALAAPIDGPAQRDRAAALWGDALAAAEQVQRVTAGAPDDRFAAPVADVRARAAGAEKQRRMLTALEDARDGKAEIDDNDFNRVLKEDKRRVPFFFSHNGLPRYERAFREYGIDIDALPVEEAAARVAASPVAGRLVFALDDWYTLQPAAPRAAKLIAIAARADGDPVRKRVRAAIIRNDRPALEAIAAEPLDLPPQTAVLLAFGLEEYKNLGPSAAVLGRAVRKHPDDFWLQNAYGLYCGFTTPPRYDDSGRAALAALAARPTSHVALANVADTLAYLGRFDEAVEYARRAVECRPDLAYVHAKLVHAYRAANRPEDAIRAAEAARVRFPNSFTVQYMLGTAYMTARRWADAEAALQRGLEMNANYAKLHLALAQLHFTRGHIKAGEAALTEGRQRAGADPEDRIQVGHLLGDLGRTDEALAELRTAAEMVPDWPDLWTVRCRALLYAGRYPEAVEAARKGVRGRPQNPYPLADLATALRNAGEVGEALELARAAAQGVPNYVYAHTEVGLCLEYLRRFAEAETAFRAALAGDPTDANAGRGLSRVLHVRGDLRGAIEAVAAVVARQPHNAEAQWQFGVALQASNQPEPAEAAYRAAIRLRPKWATPHNDLGVLLEKLGRTDEALTEYTTAVNLDPNAAVVQTNYGMRLARLGRLAEAEAVFRAVIAQRRPNFESAHRALVDLLLAAGPARRVEALSAAFVWTGAEPLSAAAHNATGNALLTIGLAEPAAGAYGRAAALQPKEPFFHDNLGQALTGLRRYGEAADAHRRAWDLAPNNGAFAGRLIGALTAAKRLDAAKKVADDALQKLPHDASVRSAVAAVLLEQKDIAGAEAELRRAVELAPKAARFRSELGLLLETAGRPVEAVGAYEVAFDLARADAAAALAFALGSAGQPDRAAKVATAGLFARPNDFYSLRARGRARLDLRELDAAIADLTAALRAAEGRTDVLPARRADTHLWLAQAQYVSGRFPDALASARAAERLAPDADAARTAAHLAGNAADALRFEARAEAIGDGTFRPNGPGEKAALATYLVLAGREPVRAYDLFAEALDADPKLAENRNELFRYNAGRAGVRAAALAADAPEASARRTRARAWLSAEWAATPPVSRARRAGIWLRDPALAPVRDDAPLGALPWFERCAWRLFWEDLRRATELPDRP